MFTEKCLSELKQLDFSFESHLPDDCMYKYPDSPKKNILKDENEDMKASPHRSSFCFNFQTPSDFLTGFDQLPLRDHQEKDTLQFSEVKSSLPNEDLRQSVHSLETDKVSTHECSVNVSETHFQQASEEINVATTTIHKKKTVQALKKELLRLFREKKIHQQFFKKYGKKAYHWVPHSKRSKVRKYFTQHG